VGAVLAEQHDEWAEAHRYMSVESLAKARLRVLPGDGDSELAAAPPQAVALSA